MQQIKTQGRVQQRAIQRHTNQQSYANSRNLRKQTVITQQHIEQTEKDSDYVKQKLAAGYTLEEHTDGTLILKSPNKQYEKTKRKLNNGQREIEWETYTPETITIKNWQIIDKQQQTPYKAKTWDDGNGWYKIDRKLYDPNKEEIWDKPSNTGEIKYAKPIGVTPRWAEPVKKAPSKTIYQAEINGKIWRSPDENWLKNKIKEETTTTATWQDNFNRQSIDPERIKQEIKKYEDSKKPIYTIKKKGESIDTRTDRTTTIPNNINNNTVETYFKRLVKGATAIPKAMGKGVTKQYFNQELDRIERFIKDTKPELLTKVEKFKKENKLAQILYVPPEERLTDEEMNSARIGELMVGGSYILPRVVSVIGGGFIAKQSYDTVKNPTPENIGTTAFMIAPAGYGKAKGKFEIFKIPKEFRQEWKAYRGTSKGFRETTRNIGNVAFERVESLKNNLKLQKNIAKTLKESKEAILGGTAALETGGIKLKRGVKDLDIYSKDKLTGSVIKDFSKNLEKEGIKHQVNGDKIYIDGKKTIEVHGINQMMKENINSVSPIYKPHQLYIYETPNGIKIIDPNILAMRKWKGAFEDNLYRYSKDAPAFVQSAKQLLKQEGKSWKTKVPIVGQYKQYKTGMAKRWLKPYEQIGKYSEAQPIPNYYTGKTPKFYEGLKDIQIKPIGKKAQTRLRKLRKDSKPQYKYKYKQRKFKYRAINYKKKSNKQYRQKYEPKQKKTGYTKYEEPQTQYYGQSNYQPSQTKYAPQYKNQYYPTYTEEKTKTLTTIGKTNIKPKKKTTKKIPKKQKSKKLDGYRPVYDQGGIKFEGRLYSQLKNAIMTAMKNTDKTKATKFTIKKSLGDYYNKPKTYKTPKKYKKSGSTFIEKHPFRKDSKGEGGMNIWDYV